MRTRRGASVTACLTVVLAALLAWSPPAQASNSAPVTQPDSVTLVAGSRYVPLDLMANDADPDGETPFFCGTEEETPPEIWILTYGKYKSQEAWASRKARPGTYTVTYYACDESFASSAGTLTITVLEPLARQLTLKDTRRPGKVRVVNDSPSRIRLLWGAWDEKKRDGRTTVKAGRSRVITVHRTSIAWAVLSGPEFGLGITRGIRVPRAARSLPPGAPPGLQVESIDATPWISDALQ